MLWVRELTSCGLGEQGICCLLQQENQKKIKLCICGCTGDCHNVFKECFYRNRPLGCLNQEKTAKSSKCKKKNSQKEVNLMFVYKDGVHKQCVMHCV